MSDLTEQDTELLKGSWDAYAERAGDKASTEDWVRGMVGALNDIQTIVSDGDVIVRGLRLERGYRCYEIGPNTYESARVIACGETPIQAPASAIDL